MFPRNPAQDRKCCLRRPCPGNPSVFAGRVRAIRLRLRIIRVNRDDGDKIAARFGQNLGDDGR
ncbi:MAG: hypothetical protein LBT52_06755, partial [Clostridiales Family XIII bacterium]|nr:hypothetical protein [Clostridiales Family XIII bacterium]